ncbi:MAG: TRAP transporter small permease [Deltaproteobacteria bacterium]|nr:TRAP transporter small permease [Deltaproteobacteria bacterium]
MLVEGAVMKEANQGFWPRLESLATTLSKITGLIGAVAVLAAALVTTECVLVRKVLGWSTIWQIEASVFLLIYSCFVGAAFAQLGGHHLNIDMLIIYLPPRPREILLVVTGIASCVVCVIIAWYAWPMWWQTIATNEHSESLWGPPLWIPYMFLPLGATLLFLQSTVQIWRKIVALRTGAFEETLIPSELKDIDIPGADSQERKGGDHE